METPRGRGRLTDRNFPGVVWCLQEEFVHRVMKIESKAQSKLVYLT